MELAVKLFSALFPSRCMLCHRTIAGEMINANIELCADCYQAQPFNLLCCTRCALPLADDTGRDSLCGRCISRLPAYDYTHSVFRYEDDIIRLVHQLKFGEKISIARSMGELLLQKLVDSGESPDCLMPVPLHKSRLRQRGFNQSIEVSRVIAKKRSIVIDYDAVSRQHRTLAQTGLSAKQRQKNIKGAFKVNKGLNYKHVLIVDDVMTTGATVNELARVLKKNKVRRVGVLSIARAPVKN